MYQIAKTTDQKPTIQSIVLEMDGVYRACSGKMELLVTLPADSLTYTDSQVTTGGSYTYQVTAVGTIREAETESGFSAAKSMTMVRTPTSLGLTCREDGTILVTWEADLQATGFQLRHNGKVISFPKEQTGYVLTKPRRGKPVEIRTLLKIGKKTIYSPWTRVVP